MNKNTWQLQEAKNKFSSLIEKALRFGPQIVTRRGEDVVVILDVDEYRKMISPKTKLVEFFKKSPLCGVSLDIERSNEYSRKIKL